MASLFEQIVAELHLQLADDTLPYAVLRASQPMNLAQRGVLWIPTHFSDQVVPQTNPLGAYDALYAERWDVECHITGLTLEDVELVRSRILYVTRLVLKTSSRPQGGTWVTQAIEDPSALTAAFAQKCIQRFTWEVNVLTPAAPTAVVQSIETDAGTDTGLLTQ
jgi:hypothetical protein